MSDTVTETVLSAKVVYARPVIDRNKPQEAKLVLAAPGGVIEYPLADTKNVLSTLNSTVFAPTARTVGWDLKPLYSYMAARGRVALNVPAGLTDLRLLEKYQGLNAAPEQAPADWAAAVRRAKVALADPAATAFHKAVHLPLLARVVPALERDGLWDTSGFPARSVRARYDIEQHPQGRLRCSVPDAAHFNPHSLSDEDRGRLRPLPPHDLFLYYDFRSMEVAVLAHLSGDARLAAIVGSGRNIYAEIYRAFSGHHDEDEGPARDKGKAIFLPVQYGMGHAALAERLGCSEDTARTVITEIDRHFPAAAAWRRAQRERCEAAGSYTDALGRTVRPDKPFQAQQAGVAGPAAAVCMERLIALHAALPASARLAYSLHDGYCLTAASKDWGEVYRLGKAVLEAPSTLLPGLALKTSLAVGKRLDGLKKFY